MFTHFFSADGDTEQRLRSLSTHSVYLEQQIEREVRQAEVMTPWPYSNTF
jgi:hypothetical protein